MTDDELLLIYKGLRDMNEAMKAREIVLDQKTTALGAVVTELKGLPFTLGKQTSQYIGMGVREAIQQDFDTPIKESFQVPIANLERATSEARSVMREVGKESRFQTWKWISIMVLCGVILGAFGSYFFYNQVIGRIDERLDTIQQQIAPVAPVPETKPSNSLKERHRP